MKRVLDEGPGRAAGGGGKWEVAAYLVRERAVGAVMAGGGALVLGLSRLGLGLWPCPFLRVTGLPCPGCGMTRSCLAILHGDWAAMWALHPFAPVFVLFWLAVGVGVLLPAGPRARFAGWLGRWERRTRWAGWTLVGLVIYSLTRWF